ncbi:unnamed protein product [Ixodes pacificus]
MSDTSDRNSDEQCKSSGKKSNKDKKAQKKAEKQQQKEQQQRNSVTEDLADPIKEFLQPEEEENEELRNKAIQAFREWVLQQPHFVNPRTGKESSAGQGVALRLLV